MGHQHSVNIACRQEHSGAVHTVTADLADTSSTTCSTQTAWSHVSVAGLILGPHQLWLPVPVEGRCYASNMGWLESLAMTFPGVGLGETSLLFKTFKLEYCLRNGW